MIEKKSQNEWKNKLAKILSLDSENRNRVIGIILSHAHENDMPYDVQQLLKSCKDDHIAQKYLTLYSSKGIE
jgi:mRNA degradation ribonuclease J1/J2